MPRTSSRYAPRSGFGPIGLYGVSYGTKLALAYALAHPASVERIALDSVVVPTYPGSLRPERSAGDAGHTESILRGRHLQRGDSELRRRRGQAGEPARGASDRGRDHRAERQARTLHMNGEDLISLTIDADLSPGLAAELPAAVHAALTGNVRPILRLRTSTCVRTKSRRRISASGSTPPRTARTDASRGPRTLRPRLEEQFSRRQSHRRRRGHSESSETGRRASATPIFCEQWPSPAGNTPLGPGPFPNVPVLAVNGGFDLRTPVANAVTVISQFPQGTARHRPRRRAQCLDR